MYVKLDTRTGELELNLPPHLKEYSPEVKSAIMDEFAFEPINKQALDEMDTFICRWFKDRGIELPSRDAGDKGEGTGKL